MAKDWAWFGLYLGGKTMNVGAFYLPSGTFLAAICEDLLSKNRRLCCNHDSTMCQTEDY